MSTASWRSGRDGDLAFGLLAAVSTGACSLLWSRDIAVPRTVLPAGPVVWATGLAAVLLLGAGLVRFVLGRVPRRLGAAAGAGTVAALAWIGLVVVTASGGAGGGPVTQLLLPLLSGLVFTVRFFRARGRLAGEPAGTGAPR